MTRVSVTRNCTLETLEFLCIWTTWIQLPHMFHSCWSQTSNAKLWLPTSHHPFLPITSQTWPYNPWSFLLATRCCSIKAFLEKNKKTLRVWAQVSMLEQTMHILPLPHAGIVRHKEDQTMCDAYSSCARTGLHFLPRPSLLETSPAPTPRAA